MRILAGITRMAEGFHDAELGTQGKHEASKNFLANADIPMEEYKARQSDLKNKAGLKKDKMDIESSKLNLQKAQSQLSDDAKLRDPNSAASRTILSMLEKQGYKFPAGTTAMDLKQQGIDIDKVIGIAAAKETRAIAAESNRIASDDKKKTKETASQNDFVERSYKSLGKQAEKLGTYARAVASAEAAIKDPNTINDTGAMYATITALDPSSTVRSSETDLLQGSMSVWGKLKADASRFKQNPELFNDKARRDMLSLVKQLQNTAKTDYDRMAKPVHLQAKTRGIPESRFSEFDSYYGQAPSEKQQVQTKQQHSPGDIVSVKGVQYRVGADGDSLEPIQ
jgi:hypothetical protein